MESSRYPGRQATVKRGQDDGHQNRLRPGEIVDGAYQRAVEAADPGRFVIPGREGTGDDKPKECAALVLERL
jgi:hypothetical protein